MMVVDMVDMVTSEKLKEMDWAKSIEICELVASDQGQAKGVIKSIKKRLGNKNGNTQLYAVMLLEMLIHNCGDHIHKQVIDNGLLPILVKIVKKKTDLPVRERIFLLLDATQTSVGGATGKYPQYYAAYYDLVAARVQFPNRPQGPPPEPSPPRLQVKNIPAQEPIQQNGSIEKPPSQIVTDLSVIEKAASVLEILKEVLNAMDPKNPEGASDEFVLDLVEQCSFQKQRIMHLVMTSRDEKMVKQAIEFNEELHKVLVQHDALLSVCAGSKPHFHVNGKDEDEEEEDEESLYLRLRKGKACVEDYPNGATKHLRSISDDKIQRPIIRPLCIQDPDSKPPPPAAVIIPPPPAKHTEREKFFKEKRMEINTGIDGHIRGLSLDSRNGSSSHSGSTDFSDRDFNGLRDS